MTTPSIEEWAEQHVQPTPIARLRAAGLEDQVRHGRELGLTYPQIVEWLALRDFKITVQELSNALR